MKFSTWIVPAMVFSLGLGACGGKDDPTTPDGGDETESTAVTITGTLSTGSLLRTASVKPMSVDLDSLTMSCVTFKVPPTAGTGEIDASGNFSFTLEDAKNSKFGCFILDSSDEVVASMVFEDSTEQDMSGENKTDSSIALSGDANFGTVVLDLESGTATVDKDAITVVAEDTSGSGYWDATGTWVFSSYGATLPDGYVDICPEGSHDRDGDCNGPAAGESVYLKHIKGVKTGTSEARYGLMIWRSQAAFTSCGSRLGATFADLSAQGVDFTGASITEGDFVFSTTMTGTDTLTDGWKSDEAETQWDWHVGCGNFEYQGDMGFRCHDGTNNTYRLEFGGGCYVTATQEPIRIDDWSQITGQSNSSAASDKHSGFQISTMTGTYTYNSTSTPITCKNEWALSGVSTFSTINNSATFDWNNVARVSQGTLCSNAAFSSYPLERLKCYAQHFEQHSREADGCFPDLRTDWTATDPDNFIQISHRTKSMHAANFFDMSADGVGSFHDEREDYWGAKSGNSWVNCKVRDAFTLTITPKNKSGETASQAILEFASETALLDTDKTACVAWFKDQMGGEKKTVAGNDIWVSRFRSLSNMTKQ